MVSCPTHDYKTILRRIGREGWLPLLFESWNCNYCARAAKKWADYPDGWKSPRKGRAMKNAARDERRCRRYSERIELKKGGDPIQHVYRKWLD